MKAEILNATSFATNIKPNECLFCGGSYHKSAHLLVTITEEPNLNNVVCPSCLVDIELDELTDKLIGVANNHVNMAQRYLMLAKNAKCIEVPSFATLMIQEYQSNRALYIAQNGEPYFNEQSGLCPDCYGIPFYCSIDEEEIAFCPQCKTKWALPGTCWTSTSENISRGFVKMLADYRSVTPYILPQCERCGGKGIGKSKYRHHSCCSEDLTDSQVRAIVEWEKKSRQQRQQWDDGIPF